jgi:hypothetical protein
MILIGILAAASNIISGAYIGMYIIFVIIITTLIIVIGMGVVRYALVMRNL